MFNVALIAKICHEVNKTYCESLGDYSQPKWEDAPEWQKTASILGVSNHIESDITPEQSHENWMKHKEEEGWVYGEVKDPEKRTHPCMVPYEQLPESDKTKDKLFKAVVEAFKGEL